MGAQFSNDTETVAANIRSAMVHSDRWEALDVARRAALSSIANAAARILTSDASEIIDWQTVSDCARGGANAARSEELRKSFANAA